MAKCLICGGELPSGTEIKRGGGAKKEETTCLFCRTSWTVTTNIYPSERLGEWHAEPTNQASRDRYEAFKRGRCIEAAREAERLINLGQTTP